MQQQQHELLIAFAAQAGPATRAARAAGRCRDARLAAGALAGCCAQRRYCFWLGTGRGPQREQHALLVTSVVRGLLAAPRPATVRSDRTVFWLGIIKPNVQQQQHELLVDFAVRGLLPAPW